LSQTSSNVVPVKKQFLLLSYQTKMLIIHNDYCDLQVKIASVAISCIFIWIETVTTADTDTCLWGSARGRSNADGRPETHRS
jgi:hypothetical protein